MSALGGKADIDNVIARLLTMAAMVNSGPLRGEYRLDEALRRIPCDAQELKASLGKGWPPRAQRANRPVA
jgi:hypothetical protein